MDSSVSIKKFAEKVKSAREEAGLTQEELAAKVGIHVSYLSRIERGDKDNPTKDILEKLGKYLKLRPQDLLNY